jgi:hypothetical protein
MLNALPAHSADPGATTPTPWRLAVLGDSDSQSHHDRVWEPQGRGGAYAAGTFQWTEALAKMRGAEIDAGQWGIWGTRKRLVQVMEWFGTTARAPRKEDFRYNFAFAGAGCADLNEGVFRQVPRLLEEMDREPQGWQDAVVLIRIGINGMGFAETLDRFASDPTDPAASRLVQDCLQHIGRAVQSIRRVHPSTRLVLVGVLNNADWPPYFERWRSDRSISNINRGLDGFDNGLKRLAAADDRVAFFNDRAWFRQRWGERGRDGAPAYRALVLSDGLRVELTQGDDPRHAVLADGHAGLVWNAVWAQSLVELLRSEFGAPVRPITDAEVRAFVGEAKRLVAR